MTFCFSVFTLHVWVIGLDKKGLTGGPHVRGMSSGSWTTIWLTTVLAGWFSATVALVTKHILVAFSLTSGRNKTEKRKKRSGFET